MLFSEHHANLTLVVKENPRKGQNRIKTGQKREASSLKLARDQTSNPTSSTNSTPKGRIRRSSKQKVENSHFEEHLTHIATMTDNRTMAEMLRAPTEGSEIAKLKHAVNQQTSDMTTAMTAMLKQLQANPCVTCGGAHPYYQCLATGGNTFPEFRDNIQESDRHGENELRNEMKTSIHTSLSNQTNEIKNMMASLLQMNTASTSGSGSLPGNTVANPKGKLKAITTRSRLVTDGPTIPTPPKFVTLEEDKCVEETYTDPDLAEYTIKVPPPPVQKPKPLIQRHFVLHTMDSPLTHIPFSELKCKALANLGASINLMPLSVWKKLGLPDLISTRMTLELANRAICTLDGIARDVFVPVGKFTFPADFVVVDYESDPRVPLILGRPFLRTARSLIDVHGEEMILRDGNERLTLNMKHDTASYSNHPHRESVNLINIFDISSEDCLERNRIFALPPIDQMDLANLNDLFVDPTPEMFSDEQPPDYSLHPRFDVYPDDFLEIESDADNFDNDSFDSKWEKIKEAELLIDQLDLPCDTHSEYDSFASQDFSRDDDLPSLKNEDKVFNPGILIYEKLISIITRVAQEKKLAISYASLLFEDFDPPIY
uniref:Reverse transcriptase domain-containing protein n=1 Tax=Tanacetum cinerariifolium TaxID=118510 RepID=A0A6L2LBA2_TANCI|nr:reverse transcriptase domain-containing protein [Tanacetum cinerariifolium]